MRAHNVLCNSYNISDKPLQLSSCTVCVVVHSHSFENCIAYFHSSKLYIMEPQTHIDIQRILDRKQKRVVGGYNVESCEVQCLVLFTLLQIICR
jgi:hypothetical protein